MYRTIANIGRGSMSIFRPKINYLIKIQLNFSDQIYKPLDFLGLDKKQNKKNWIVNLHF
jgi:hypothetical protein